MDDDELPKSLTVKGGKIIVGKYNTNKSLRNVELMNRIYDLRVKQLMRGEETILSKRELEDEEVKDISGKRSEDLSMKIASLEFIIKGMEIGKFHIVKNLPMEEEEEIPVNFSLETENGKLVIRSSAKNFSVNDSWRSLIEVRKHQLSKLAPTVLKTHSEEDIEYMSDYGIAMREFNEEGVYYNGKRFYKEIPKKRVFTVDNDGSHLIIEQIDGVIIDDYDNDYVLGSFPLVNISTARAEQLNNKMPTILRTRIDNNGHIEIIDPLFREDERKPKPYSNIRRGKDPNRGVEVIEIADAEMKRGIFIEDSFRPRKHGSGMNKGYTFIPKKV